MILERREPGLFGTLFAFGSPLLVGLFVTYEWAEWFDLSDLSTRSPSSAMLFPQTLSPAPLACVLLGWLGLGIVLQIFAWFMNGRGTLLETLGTIGRMIGTLGVVEAIRLVGVLNGLNEWVGLAWFLAAALLVLGWTGRAWGKLHLLSRKETVMMTLACFYAPALATVVISLYPALKDLR